MPPASLYRQRRREFAVVYVCCGLALWAGLSSTGLVSFEPNAVGSSLRTASPPSSLSGDLPTSLSLERRLSEDEDSSDMSAVPLESGKKWQLIFYILGVVYMFLALGIVVDEFFVPALEEIADSWELTPDIAGATLMAAGGSAPELFTSLIATFNRSAVGFGTIVGSAVFNVLFVIGTVAVMSKTELKLTWWPLFRDCVYYTFSLIVLAVFFKFISGGEIVWWEALILLCMYGGYVYMMKHNQKIRFWLMRKVGKDEDQKKLRKRDSLASKEPVAVDNPVAATESSIVIAKQTYNKSSIDDIDGEDGIGELELPTAKTSKANFRRPSTFRAGLVRMMVSDRPLSETTSVLAVTQLAGNVHETFRQIDTNNDGLVSRDELQALIERLTGSSPTSEQLDELVDSLDANKDGMVEFKEFQQWYLVSEQRLRSDVKKAFELYDTNKDGHIDATEFGSMLRALGQSADDSEVYAIIQELDQNGNGEIEENEFYAWYEKSPFYLSARTKQKVEAETADGMSIWEMPKSGRGRFSWLVSLPLMVTLVYSLPDVRLPENVKYKYWGFFGSIVWIGAYSWFMVNWATIIGATLGIPDAVMGLTFLAAGTSVPDLLSSVVVALKGEGDMAVSSSIGSNIFDVLIGLPFPWLLFSIVKGTSVTVAAPNLARSIFVLIAMLVAVVSAVSLSGWKITKPLGYTMFFLYGVFVAQDLCAVYECF